jgi:hypothetical protein
VKTFVGSNNKKSPRRHPHHRYYKKDPKIDERMNKHCNNVKSQFIDEDEKVRCQACVRGRVGKPCQWVYVKNEKYGLCMLPSTQNENDFERTYLSWFYKRISYFGAIGKRTAEKFFEDHPIFCKTIKKFGDCTKIEIDIEEEQATAIISDTDEPTREKLVIFNIMENE